MTWIESVTLSLSLMYYFCNLLISLSCKDHHRRHLLQERVTRCVCNTIERVTPVKSLWETKRREQTQEASVELRGSKSLSSLSFSVFTGSWRKEEAVSLSLSLESIDSHVRRIPCVSSLPLEKVNCQESSSSTEMTPKNFWSYCFSRTWWRLRKEWC